MWVENWISTQYNPSPLAFGERRGENVMISPLFYPHIVPTGLDFKHFYTAVDNKINK